MMMIVYFLLVANIILVTAYKGHKEKAYYNYIYSLLPKETLDYSPGMVLSCGNVTTEDVSEPPVVSWYFYEHMKYRLLNCSTFWLYEYKNDMCKYGSGHYPRFEGPASFPCTLSSDSSQYVCTYTHKDIIPLKFKCVISTHVDKNHKDKNHEIQKIKIIYVVDNVTGEYKKWSMKPCFIPSIENVSAELSSNRSINVHLQFSMNKPISKCIRPVCNSSKKYKGKVIVYDSLANMKSRKYKYGGDHSTDWMKLQEGQALFTADHPAIALGKYYKIIVKSMTKYKKRMNKEKWTKEIKAKCYFGVQSPALISHSTMKIIEAPIGSQVNVSCSGKGNPLPTMGLLYEYDGANVTLAEGKSEVSYLVAVMDSYVVYCMASNSLISPGPCGEIKLTHISSAIEIIAL